MIRVLNAAIVSLDVPLQLYLERTDLWSDGVTDAELTTFQVDDDILLQHTYVILRELEKQKESSNTSRSPQNGSSIQDVEGQQRKAQAWFDATAKPTTTPKVVKSTTQKLRV